MGLTRLPLAICGDSERNVKFMCLIQVLNLLISASNLPDSIRHFAWLLPFMGGSHGTEFFFAGFPFWDPGDPELLGLPGQLLAARRHALEAPLQGTQLALDFSSPNTSDLRLVFFLALRELVSWAKCEATQALVPFRGKPHRPKPLVTTTPQIYLSYMPYYQ